MKNDFLLAITQLAAERNLPKDLVFEAVETALSSTYRKDETIGNYDISVSIFPASGQIKVFAEKVAVEKVEDKWHEISLADAKKIKKDVALGETVKIEIEPPDSGRIGVQTAKQVVMQRLREAEREFIFGTFAHREGEVLTGVIQQIDHRQITIDLGQADGILPLAEQVRTEHYRAGQRIKVYLLEVSQTTKGPRLLLSRTHTNLVQRMFELEVPEIASGLVEVKSIAREPGSRTKMAVTAKQDEIDPVGSCIGLRGIRIQNVINELQGEKIDVIQWQADPQTFITSALSPAQALNVILNHDEMSAIVIVPDNQLSLAIGKEGQNARLTAKLTNWKIDIKSISAATEEQILIPEPEVPAPQVEDIKEDDEIVEEVIPVEEIIKEEETPRTVTPVDGPVIRFAEDVLPKPTADKAEKSKKKFADEKPKGKKKAKRVRIIEDDDDLLEDIFEDDLDDIPMDDFEDDIIEEPETAKPKAKKTKAQKPETEEPETAKPKAKKTKTEKSETAKPKAKKKTTKE